MSEQAWCWPVTGFWPICRGKLLTLKDSQDLLLGDRGATATVKRCRWLPRGVIRYLIGGLRKLIFTGNPLLLWWLCSLRSWLRMWLWWWRMLSLRLRSKEQTISIGAR